MAPSSLCRALLSRASMKALPKRKGNTHDVAGLGSVELASMKALPKRKGNHSRGAERRTAPYEPQ